MSDPDIPERVITDAIDLVGTPCYVLAAPVVRRNLRQLQSLFDGFPIRHVLSAKTQPVRPLLEIWNRLGLMIDVVSEFELAAALEVGFEPSRIVVNGVCKHRWLSRYELPELRVHLDSVQEAAVLAAQARSCRWSVGLRLNLPRSIEFDPDEPQFGTQFGVTIPEAAHVRAELQAHGVSVNGIHFHIGTDLRGSERYEKAISWTKQQLAQLGWRVRYLDIGGGLPLADACNNGQFDLQAFRSACLGAHLSPEPIAEIWLENGRFISGTAGALVVRVHDVKVRDDTTYVICDGGRTNHALVSEWEAPHPIELLPRRSGPTALTTICGPSCMAFDRLGRFDLPPIEADDVLVWRNAGAYHIPWETRFSRGRCPVVWCDEDWKVHVARARETPQGWWSEWSAGATQ